MPRTSWPTSSAPSSPRSGPNFRLAKLEGDAAFTWMPGETIDGSMLLDTIERCYFGFRRRRRDVRQATSCPCNACVRIPDLDLKFVVHHGEAIVQKVAGRQELLGSDVIVVHRLLKNDVVERLGIKAYALLSQAAIDAAGIDPAALGMRRAHGDVRADRRGAALGPRPRAPLAGGGGTRPRPRHAGGGRPGPDRADRACRPRWPGSSSPGPASACPGSRGSPRSAIEGATGGRRGPGSANHCRHGKDAVIEEILDWRPYDYVTDRTILDTPDGPVKVAPHDRAGAGPQRHDHPSPVRGAEDEARDRRRWRTSGRPTAPRSSRASRGSSPSWMPSWRRARPAAAPSPSWPRHGRMARWPGLQPLVMID